MDTTIYRIASGNTAVGVIAVKAGPASKEVATAFAQGKYGSDAAVDVVTLETALEASAVCEIMKTKEIRIDPGTRQKTVRVLA